MSRALFELWYHCTAEKSTFEFGLVNQALVAAYRTLIKVLCSGLKKTFFQSLPSGFYLVLGILNVQCKPWLKKSVG